MWKTFISAAVFASSFYSVSHAQVIQYVDRNGKTHFVSAAEKVPAEYRSQVEHAKELPPISRYAADMKPPSGRSSDDSGYAASSEKPKVEIFVTAWCPYCKQLEAYLKAHRIDYTRHDIEKSAAARMMYEELGGGGLPTTRIGSTVIQGFDEQAIGSAIKAAQKQ